MDWSYPSNPQGVESVWLPNAYLESVLAAFQPRQGDQTAHEILRGHTCAVQAPQNHVLDEPIRPSRPRELPFPFHLSDTSPTGAPLVAQPRPATPRPYANSYTSVGDYAQSFFHPKDDKPDASRSLQGYLPIPDGRQSSYSELAANLDFLVEVSNAAPTPGIIVEHGFSAGGDHPPAQAPRTDAGGLASAFSRTSPQPSDLCRTPEPPIAHLEGPPLPSHRRKTLKKAVEALQAQNAKVIDIKRKYASKTLGPGPTSPGQPASQALKRLLDPKKPKMACYFCRDRKIACGNPGEGALDRTCDQCRKRQLPCAYSTQSRRGIRSDKKKDTGAN